MQQGSEDTVNGKMWRYIRSNLGERLSVAGYESAVEARARYTKLKGEKEGRRGQLELTFLTNTALYWGTSWIRVLVPQLDTIGEIYGNHPREDNYSAHTIDVHSRRTEYALPVKNQVNTVVMMSIILFVCWKCMYPYIFSRPFHTHHNC